jgi:hypothetical protein
MNNNTRVKAGLKTQIHYESTAAQLELSELWQKYAADLAYELFSSDEKSGDAFIQNEHITTADPTELNKEASKEHVWISQVRIGLPLIEMERCRYITSQYGRLLGVLGAEYWNDKTKEYKVIWDNRKNAPLEDPYAIDIITLQQLGYMNKRLEMLGTVSLTPFFSVSAGDMKRFNFLAKISEKLAHFQLCSPGEMEELFCGHLLVYP